MNTETPATGARVPDADLPRMRDFVAGYVALVVCKAEAGADLIMEELGVLRDPPADLPPWLRQQAQLAYEGYADRVARSVRGGPQDPLGRPAPWTD